MGRPPAVTRLPYGSCQIISFEAAEQQPQPLPLAVIHSRASAEALSNSPISPYDMDTEEGFSPLTISPYRSTASFSEQPSSGPPGPSYYSKNSLAELLAGLDALDGAPVALSAGWHKLVHGILSDAQAFYGFHRKFMIGPGFSESFRHAVVAVMESSPNGGVLESYTAVLALWDARSNKVKDFSALDLSRGSQCLKRLQTSAITHAKDAAVVVMLGQVLALYHIVALCTSAHAILRRSLLLVKNWYPELMNQPALHPITITPILMDTVESLVRREIPVVRAPPESAASYSVVDRSAGLCLGLLHLQYEVCRIGHRAKTAAAAAAAAVLETTDDGPSVSHSFGHVVAFRDDLERVRSQVSAWEPRPPTRFFTDHTPLAVSAMMMQARLYRLATLLAIHRLQHPLGVEDEPAARLAMAIAAELECFALLVPDDSKGLAIGFPLLLAMLEIEHVNEKAVRYVAPDSAVSTYVDELKYFVQLVKAARDSGFRGLWFDIAENKLTVPVLA